jgi:HRD ubiquitin ligase complex, ER membrane component
LYTNPIGSVLITPYYCHSKEMPCGHNIHWHCFKSLASHDIRCPICKKTATFEDMTDVWDGLAQDIAEQPLPPELTRCVDVICNDCGTRDENRRWHYLGVQCRKCGTFNTSHNTKMQGVEAHEYLSALETEHHHDDDNSNTD